jgi:hypothetical protein
MDGRTCQFKPGAHIPKGVTPEGVQEERDRIDHDYGGKATIENAVDAVMAHPDKYPNLRAFGPADETEAMRRGIMQGIRMAFRVVVVERLDPGPQAVPRYVRVIHSVQDDEGNLVYKPIEVIRQDPAEKKYLIASLRRDAVAYSDKQRDVLAEIEEAI